MWELKTAFYFSECLTSCLLTSGSLCPAAQNEPSQSDHQEQKIGPVGRLLVSQLPFLNALGDSSVPIPLDSEVTFSNSLASRTGYSVRLATMYGAQTVLFVHTVLHPPSLLICRLDMGSPVGDSGLS